MHKQGNAHLETLAGNSKALYVNYEKLLISTILSNCLNELEMILRYESYVMAMGDHKRYFTKYSDREKEATKFSSLIVGFLSAFRML
jgi:hypothetical protein